MRSERGKEGHHHLVVAVSCLSVSFTFTISAVTSAAFIMSSVKLHSSLPTSMGHAGASLQAKSSVLTGVQDAYWSDEEVRVKNTSITIHTQLITYFIFILCSVQDAKECPLCLEEMDISDLNFKPCQCEYQVSARYPIPFSSVHSFLNRMNATTRHRFADSAGITLGRTSTINVLLAEGIIPTKLASSSPSISKSVSICPIH